MPIYLLETTRRCAAGWTRYSHYVQIPALEGLGLIDALVQLAERLACRPVLILTSDESVNFISEQRQQIESRFRISLPSAAMVRSLSDKTKFQELAEREGFSVPRSVCVADDRSLERLGTLQPPLVIKPADKTLVLRGAAERAVCVESVSEARRLASEMLRSAPSVIVQEWIDGPDTELFFALFACDRNAQILGLFPGRKLVCWPPAIGSTAVCVAAPEVARELTAQTTQFIRSVGYRGLGSLEFKRDSRTGRFLIIEPTVGRTDWQEEIATLCGVNLPLLTYLAELDTPAPTSAGTFLPRAWRSSVRFRSRLPPGVRMIDGFFRWPDPFPAFYYYGYERALMRVWRRAWRGLRQSSP
jgi:predicted ATP-grasp superfamily ATP-dependent carboligase